MQEIRVQVTTEPIEVGEIHSALIRAESGAQIVFVGTVRNTNDGRPVRAVSYEAHEALAEKTCRILAEEAEQKFGPLSAVILVLRLGTLLVREVSTCIGVAGPHRQECYEASRYLIEQFKVRVPMWKEEHYLDGERRWLDGTELSAERSACSARGRSLEPHGAGKGEASRSEC